MAKNFRIQKKHEGRKNLCLQLFGDFDGASANQLLYLLKLKISKTDCVTIDTNGLRDVRNFGVEVFLPRMARLNHSRIRIVYTGKFRRTFGNG